MQDEFFIPIKLQDKDFSGLYEISNYGNIVSIRNPKFPKLLRGYSDGRRGYLKVKLYDKDNNVYNYFIHRLVLISFSLYNGEDIDMSITVDHINNIKLDNRLENLRWLSLSQNAKKKLLFKNKVSQLKSKILSYYYIRKYTMNKISFLLNVDEQDVSYLIRGKRYFLKTGESYVSYWCRRKNIPHEIFDYSNLNSVSCNKRIRYERSSETSV